MRTLLISRAAASSNDSVSSKRQELRMEAGQVAQRGREHGHRRGVGRDVLELVLQALVQQLVGGQHAAETVQLVLAGQPAEDQQPGGLDEVGPVGELLDGDPAVAEDALVAVDEGDGALANRRVATARGRR